MRRSTAAPNASKAATTSSRSSPRSMARWLRVPGGHADEGDVMGGGDAGHQGLGAVAAGHAEHVGAAGHGLLGKPAQVVARTEHDRFDAAPARLLDQVESFDLAATGPGVHEQHRADRGSHDWCPGWGRSSAT